MRQIAGSSDSGLRELLNGIFFNYRLLLVTFLGPLILSFLYSTVLEVTYTSQTKFLVLLSRQHIPGQGLNTAGFGGSLNMQSRIVRAEAEILGSRELMTDVVQTVGADLLYPKIDKGMYENLIDGREQAAVTQLAKDILITPLSSSDIIQVVYEHTDPFIAARVVNLMVDTFLKHRSKIFSSDGELVLKERLDGFVQQLADLDERIRQQRRENDFFDFAIEKKTLLQRVAGVINQQLTSKIAISGLDARIEEMQKLIDLIPEQIDTGKSGDGSLSALNTAINVRNKLQLEMLGLVNTYKPESRFIQDIKIRVEEAKKLVKELEASEFARKRTGRNRTYDNVIYEIIGLQAQLEQKKSVFAEQSTAVKDINEQLTRLESSENIFKSLSFERLIVIEKITKYEKSLEKEHLARLLEKQYQDPTIRIIERARPSVKGKSVRLQIIVIGFLCGIIFSLTTIYLTSICRTILVTPEETERTLGIPVLLSIGLKEAK